MTIHTGKRKQGELHLFSAGEKEREATDSCRQKSGFLV